MRYLDWAIAVGGIVLLLQLLAMVTELLVYLVMARWYFSAGPSIIRHRWQTRLGAAEAGAAIETALGGTKLAWRRYGAMFAVRRPWWQMSAYPRITLSVEPAAEGAAIVAQVKPFVSGALFLYPAFLPIPRLIWFSLLILGLCAGMYAYFFFWELRRLRALDLLRDRLAAAGVRACGKCGYDLYGLKDDSPCPECGAATIPAPTA
jgi:hypothetical protein